MIPAVVSQAALRVPQASQFSCAPLQCGKFFFRLARLIASRDFSEWSFASSAASSYFFRSAIIGSRLARNCFRSSMMSRSPHVRFDKSFGSLAEAILYCWTEELRMLYEGLQQIGRKESVVLSVTVTHSVRVSNVSIF